MSESPTPRPSRQKRPVWGRKSTRVGAALVLLIVATAVLSLVWLPHPAGEQDLNRSLLPPGWSGFPFGTDLNGRDLLSRIMVGAQASLFVGVASVAIGGL